MFVVQDGRIRRLSPLECERLMGFPDNYTDIKGASRTNRYQAIGNSWAVPVVRWIGNRLINNQGEPIELRKHKKSLAIEIERKSWFYDLKEGKVLMAKNQVINTSSIPNECNYHSLLDIISKDAPKAIYISPVGCRGIVRRKEERKLNINERLEKILLKIANEMEEEEIEKRSRIQKRGKYSTTVKETVII
ncbi:MAG: DNA cytosine methyltransferase [Lachnospiraceae bacterium]